MSARTPKPEMSEHILFKVAASAVMAVGCSALVIGLWLGMFFVVVHILTEP